jgi:transposase
VSSADEVEPRIGELRAAHPTMPATVIAQRIGWKRSIRTLPGQFAQLRPVYLPTDPASRISYVAGEIGQHDFRFPDIQLPVGYGQVRTATSSIVEREGLDGDELSFPLRFTAITTGTVSMR